MNDITGEIAALLTSAFFSLSATFNTFASQRFASMVINRLRLALAAFLLMLTHLILYGSILPITAEPARWFWLSISGVVGLVLGDIFLLNGYSYVGARLTSLMMSLAPVIATLTAWLFLGERLGLGKLAGILVTLLGIAWVVFERQNGNRTGSPANMRDRRYLIGILFGLGAATGQALGLVLSKKGMGGSFSPISANVIRMLAAMLVMWLLTIFQGQVKATYLQLSKTPRAIWFIVFGMLAGPFIGVSFSLLAVQHADVGIASTLMALPPVLLLPIGHYIFKERFGWTAILGTLMAVVGVAMIFLV